MYNNELIIDQVTEIMAVFAWETSRMVDQMSLDQKKFVRSMLNKYQIYVITEPGYKRKDQKNRVKELTKDTIGLYSSDYRTSSQFHSLTEKSLNNDFMKLSNNSFEKSDDAFIPKGVAVMGFKNKTHNVKFSMNGSDQKQEQVQTVTSREKKSMKNDARKQLFDGLNQDQSKSSNDQMMQMMVMMQERMIRQDEVLSGIMNKIENTDTQLDGTNALDVTTVNRKMANDLSKLTEMTMKGQSFDNIAWQDTPDWLRNQFKLGLKRGAIGTVKLPLRAVKGLLNEGFVKPVVEVAEFYWGKIRFIIGHVHWFFIIGGVIHLYQTSDYETVNDMYQAYGGNIVDKLVIDPTMYIGKQIVDTFPGSVEILSSIWEATGQHIINFVKSVPGYIWNNFWSWFKKILTETIKEVVDDSLSKLTPSILKGWF